MVGDPDGPLAAAPRTVALAFVGLGMFWGTWAVSVADVQRTFHLSDLQLGLLLSVAIGAAALTGAVLSHGAERWGTGPFLAWSLVAWAVLLVGSGFAPNWATFAVFFCAAEVAAGCVDTAMNAAASRRLIGRPGALVRFHALFNSGALCGAAGAGVIIGLGLSWRVVWPTLAIGALLLAWDVRRSQRPLVATQGENPDAAVPDTVGPLRRLRLDGLLVFLAVFALAEIVEGGVDTWGVLYLRTHLAAGVLLGAGAYCVGQSVAATTRGAGGPLLGRLRPRYALVVGGVLAGGGVLLESASPRVGLAAVGLACGAAGASLFWPLVMSQTARQASRPTAAVGAFTAAGYVGWVAGAPIVGWVSDRDPARGLQLLAAMAAVVVVASLARRERSAPAPAPR